MGVRFSFAELDCFVASLDTEHMQLARIWGDIARPWSLSCAHVCFLTGRTTHQTYTTLDTKVRLWNIVDADVPNSAQEET